MTDLKKIIFIALTLVLFSCNDDKGRGKTTRVDSGWDNMISVDSGEGVLSFDTVPTMNWVDTGNGQTLLNAPNDLYFWIGNDTIIKKKRQSEEFVWPKKIRDSVWMESSCDTVFGRIEFYAESGIIKGDGMVTSCMYFEMKTAVYKPEDQAAIDSYQNKRMSWTSIGGGFWSGDPIKTAYIKENGKWKEIRMKFTLTPY